MRLLFLSQGRTIDDQPDFAVSFQNATSEGKRIEVVNLPFIGYAEKYGWAKFFDEVVRTNEEFRPDVVYFQFFHSTKARVASPADCIRRLRESDNRPLIFGSLGDPFHVGAFSFLARRMPQPLKDLAANCDAFFSTSMGGIASELVSLGARNVVFLPHAFCPQHFRLPEKFPEAEKEFDAVFLGSYAPIFGFRVWLAYRRGFARKLTVKELTRKFGSRFGLFGRGWSGVSARGLVPFKQQLDVFRQSKTAVDVPAQIDDTYYASDRPFFIAGSGTPLVMRYVDRFDKILKPERDVYFAKTIKEIPEVCERVAGLPNEVLKHRFEETLSLIKARHMIDNRVDTIISTAEAILKHRRGKLTLAQALRNLRLWHFLPEVDLEVERKYAIANWVG